MGKYIDFELIEQYPNKYNLTIKSIKNLVIADWEKLKKKTWHNEAMAKTGSWWCHSEGCNKDVQPYDDEDEFWIGFREDDNKIDCHFSSYEGMCGYTFEKFYSAEEIENKYDMQVQVNAIRWLNSMIDDGILALSK